jgi:capsular exopolysaccharide synthesis family protein
VRGLQLGLTLSNVDRQPKVVLVTSSVASEGKTTVAINLARLAAKNGQKVILVDCDLRRPSVADSMGIKDRQRGIAEAVAGSAPLNDCLVRDPRSGMVLLPAVGKIPNPSELLSSMAMQSLVEKLRGYFDLVVIDSAPVLPVNDSKVVSKLTDAVLFVVRWERTPREAVSNGVRALADVKAPVAGIALTRADTKRHRYYNYGYHDYGSTKYYTE